MGNLYRFAIRSELNSKPEIYYDSMYVCIKQEECMHLTFFLLDQEAYIYTEELAVFQEHYTLDSYPEI